MDKLCHIPGGGPWNGAYSEKAMALSSLFSLTAPVLISALCLYALMKKVDVYAALCEGARKGLGVIADMLPALICLFPALWLFRETVLAWILSPVFESVGIPPETGLIMLLRPLSGSAALSEASALIARYGADSLIGRTAAVMIGSSETSFYVIAVYFSAAGVKNSRWAVPAALAADMACFLSGAWICRIMWG